MSAHTPLPWTYSEAKHGWRILGPPRAHDGARWLIATTASAEPEDEANANLIVAAPDLLVALRERVEYACRWSCGHEDSGRPINHSPECLWARAAIAKVEGR